MSQTVFITGTSKGIGLEFAQQYSSLGYKVIATCRAPEKAQALFKLKKERPDLIEILALDVSDLSQICTVAAYLKGQAIDLLINNAGSYGRFDSVLGNIDEQSWQDTFKVNCIAPIKIIEALLNNVVISDEKKIISITSKMGSMDDNHSGGSYVYRSSKAGLNAAMKSVAVDLQEYGIQVAVLHPGWVKTDMGGPSAEISCETSVSAMRKVISNLSLETSGQFFEYDGSIIPW